MEALNLEGRNPEAPSGVDVVVEGPLGDGGLRPMGLPSRDHSALARCFWCHEQVETRRAWRCPSCAVLAHPGCGRELFRAVCPTPGCRSQAWSVARRDRGRPTWPRASRIAAASAFITVLVTFSAIRLTLAWVERAADGPRVAAAARRVPDGSILLTRARTSVPLCDVVACDPAWRPRAEEERFFAHRLEANHAAPVEALEAIGVAVAVTPRARDCSIVTSQGWRDGGPSTIETWFSHAVPIPVRRVERWTPADCPGYGAVDEQELVGIKLPER